MAQAYIQSFMCPHYNTKCSFGGKGIGNSVTLYCRGCGEGVYFRFKNVDLRDEDATVREDVDIL